MIFRRANLDEAADAILVLLHWNCVNDFSMELAFRQIFTPLAGIHPRNVVSLAVDELLESKYLVKVGYDSYSITKAGLRRAELNGEALYLRRAEALGLLNGEASEAEQDEVVGETLGGGEALFIPASDRTVTLNHNQPDYQETVAALDEVLKEFREDHRLDNEAKPMKDGVLKVLEGGRRLLDGGEISVEAGQDWIVKPLKWILDKFTQGALQAAAAKALEAVCKLLGIG